MALDYLKVTPDIMQKISAYDEAEKGRLVLAMIAYAMDGVEPEFEGAEKFVWPVLKLDIDRCAASVEKQTGNGGKGGRPSKKEKPNETQQNPTKPNETQQNPEEPNETQQNPTKPNESLNSNSKSNSNSNSKSKSKNKSEGEDAPARGARFTPPTLEQAEAYFREQGATILQATVFHNYYTSNGWKVGRAPMKDWQAAARRWIARDQENGVGVGNRGAPAQPVTTNPFLQILADEEGFSG